MRYRSAQTRKTRNISYILHSISYIENRVEYIASIASIASLEVFLICIIVAESSGVYGTG